MYDFLEHCACNGSAPEQFSERKMLFRNALLARMMADRTRVRYWLHQNCLVRALLPVAMLVSSLLSMMFGGSMERALASYAIWMTEALCRTFRRLFPLVGW